MISDLLLSPNQEMHNFLKAFKIWMEHGHSDPNHRISILEQTMTGQQLTIRPTLALGKDGGLKDMAVIATSNQLNSHNTIGSSVVEFYVKHKEPLP